MLTFDFYKNNYCGVELKEEQFNQLSKRAERKIRALTGLQSQSVEKLPQFQAEAYQNAVCAQIEYLNALGIENSLGVTSVMQAKVGNFSYSDGKTATTSANLGLNGVSPDVMDYLSRSGLLYKGVRTVG